MKEIYIILLFVAILIIVILAVVLKKEHYWNNLNNSAFNVAPKFWDWQDLNHNENKKLNINK